MDKIEEYVVNKEFDKIVEIVRSQAKQIDKANLEISTLNFKLFEIEQIMGKKSILFANDVEKILGIIVRSE